MTGRLRINQHDRLKNKLAWSFPKTLFEIHEYLKGNGDPAARADFERRLLAGPGAGTGNAPQKRISRDWEPVSLKKIFGQIHEQLLSEGLLPAESRN